MSIELRVGKGSLPETPSIPIRKSQGSDSTIDDPLRQFVIDNFLFKRNGFLLEENTSFLDHGIVDSTGVLELVAFVEETFHIEVADDEIVPENFDSLRSLSDYVRQKRG